MCPACMTSIALIAAGGTSASGLAVLALTRFSARKRTRVRPRNPERKGKSSPVGGRCGILRRLSDTDSSIDPGGHYG
jgi:hypothetical protein